MRPTRAAIFVLTPLLILSLAASFSSFLFWLWAGMAGLYLGLLLIDLSLLYRRKVPELQRQVAHTLPLGVWSNVHLKATNLGRHHLKLVICDFHPGSMNVSDLPLHLQVPAEHTAELDYRIQPVSRGSFWFEPAQLLIRSPLGLWWRSSRTGNRDEIKVYPNFQAVAKYTLLSTAQRLTQIGIHRRQRRGEGREFHQLREFVQGDSLRQIDWKASSRFNKMISREFQDARDQQVVFLLDCGQGMRSQDDDLSHFDHALNAVLLMTNVALRHGDAVGLMTFGGEHRWLAARKGGHQMSLILNTIYDIQPSLRGSDFQDVARQVQIHLQKRTLIIMVTNLRDEDDDELGVALKLLRQKHLVLIASMRERVLDEAVDRPVTRFRDALRLASVHAYLRKRKAIYDMLHTKGIYCVDTIPQHLPVAMINSYLDIKSRGVL